MSLWYAEHSDFVFRVVYGDKKCFHLAWRFLGTEYAMPPQGPGWNQHTIVQYDFDGQVIFQHRCQDKWKLGGGNRRNPSLANEDLCFNLVAELRQIWDGVPWHNPDPTPQEQRVIEELAGRRFLYRRVGYDERPMRLEAGNKVGEGAAECERRWDVNIDDGHTMLSWPPPADVKGTCWHANQTPCSPRPICQPTQPSTAVASRWRSARRSSAVG
jgi:hypothetical protein